MHRGVIVGLAVMGCGPSVREPIEQGEIMLAYVHGVTESPENRHYEIRGITTTEQVVPLVEGGGPIFGPLGWSPDGDMLSYSLGVFYTRIHELSTLGAQAPGDSMPNTETPGLVTIEGIQNAYWHPTMPWVAYEMPGYAFDGPAIVIHDVETGTDRTVGIGNARSCAWSPDGSRIAVWGFTYDDQGDSESGIHLIDAATGQMERLAVEHPIDVERGPGGAPVWSPQGDRLAFATVLPGEKYDLVVADVETGRSTVFPFGVDALSIFRWSPQGDQVSVSWSVGDLVNLSTYGVRIVDLTGGGDIELDALAMGWSPDGSMTATTYVHGTSGSRLVIEGDDGFYWESSLVDGTYNSSKMPVWRPGMF